MKFADGIGLRSHFYCKHCHAEIFCLIVRLDSPKSYKGLYADTDLFCKFAKITAYHILRESIYASRYRRMSGEYVGRADYFRRLIIGKTFIFHDLEQPFDRHESRMPFVHVTYRGQFVQCLEHFYSTHAQDYLLLEACIQIPSIKI